MCKMFIYDQVKLENLILPCIDLLSLRSQALKLSVLSAQELKLIFLMLFHLRYLRAFLGGVVANCHIIGMEAVISPLQNSADTSTPAVFWSSQSSFICLLHFILQTQSNSLILPNQRHVGNSLYINNPIKTAHSQTSAGKAQYQVEI